MELGTETLAIAININALTAVCASAGALKYMKQTSTARLQSSIAGLAIVGVALEDWSTDLSVAG